MTNDLYSRLYLWLIARRRTVLIVTLLLAAIGAAFSLRFDMDEDILGILSQKDPIVSDYKYSLKKFRQIGRAYMDVSAPSAEGTTLALAADEFYSHLATNAGLGQINYQVDLGNQRGVINFLTGALPNLFTAEDEKLLAEKITTNSVHEFLTVMRRKLAGPEGMVLKDVVAADPIGMSALVLPKLLPLQSGFGGAHIEDGRLTSSNGLHVLIVAEPKFAAADFKNTAPLIAQMVKAARTVETNFPGARVAITGGHRMSLDNATQIRRDSIRCVIIAFNAMFILCFIAYRRHWLAAVTFLPSLFGTIVAGAVLALVDEHISAIAIGLASMALGITVDYGIYVVYHLDNAATDRDSAGKIAGRLVLPTITGALTIVSAFVVLAFSPMHGYQQLGIFGAVGVLASAAFALIVLPLLVPLPKKKMETLPPLRFSGWMENFHAWQKKKRPLLLLGVVALTVVAIVGVKKLRFEGDIAKLNGITASTAADDKLISDAWGDALGMTLVVARGKTVEAALALNDRANAQLAQQTNVAGIYSIAPVCPSAATQLENIRRWDNFWTVERKESLRATLEQTARELGFRPDAFAPFWKTVEEKAAPFAPDRFNGTPLENSFAERVAVGTNDVAISTFVKLNDRSRVDELRTALTDAFLTPSPRPNGERAGVRGIEQVKALASSPRPSPPLGEEREQTQTASSSTELMVIDGKNFSDHIAAIAERDMGKFALITAFIVGGIAYAALGSLEVTLATLLPIAFGLLWTLGLMGLFGVPIDIMNSVFVIFVIGMGEDYSVFLATSKLDVWRGHPPRISPTSASVLISAATTIFGFAVLAFAQHPILYSLGTTVLLGMVSTFIATLVITPACMDLLLFRRPPTGAPRWWHLLGTLQIAVHLAALQIFTYFVLRPIWFLLGAKNIPDRLRGMIAYLSRGMFYALPFGKFHFKNFSRETFSPPCIVVSNHQSAVDVMVFVAWAETVRQTAKKRVFDEPYLGKGCKLLGHVQVEPGRPEITLERCREKLAEGASVHFYPEGTRSEDGWVQRFHRGAFELAIELNQEIQPLILCDTATMVPRDAFWIEPFRVVGSGLPRVTPKNFDYTLGATALMKHCEQIVRDGLQKELDDANTPKILRRKVRRLYRYQGRFIEQFVLWKLRLDRMFPALDKAVPRQGFILDLGCGYGLATNWLAQCTDTRTFLGVDYDADKIRVAQQTAPEHSRIRFQHADILEMDYPPCDTVLLLDVLHYWTPEKQQNILTKALLSLRPGGKLILREAAKAGGQAHRHTRLWEIFATVFGLNRTSEGLHFRTLEELQAALKRAGFTHVEFIHEADKNSNVLLVATVN